MWLLRTSFVGPRITTSLGPLLLMRTGAGPCGCCWVIQWMLPPPSRSSLEGTATTFLSGNTCSKIAFALHPPQHPKVVFPSAKLSAFLPDASQANYPFLPKRKKRKKKKGGNIIPFDIVILHRF